MGITSALAGSAMVVARWKFRHRKRECYRITVDVKSSCAAPMTNRSHADDYKSRNYTSGTCWIKIASQPHIETKLRSWRRKCDVAGGDSEIAQRFAGTDRRFGATPVLRYRQRQLRKRNVSWKLASNRVPHGFTRQEIPRAAIPSPLSAARSRNSRRVTR